MQARCTLLASSRGPSSRVRPRIRRECRSANEKHRCTERGGFLLHFGRPGVSQGYHSSFVACDFRNLHASSLSLASAPALSTLADEKDDDDEFTSLIESSYLGELLRDELMSFEQQENDWPSLDDELGEGYIWDAPFIEDYSSTDEKSDPVVEAWRAQKPAPKRSTHEVLANFDPQSPPSTDNLEDLELWLECEAQRESVLRYQKVTDSARERRDYASMGPVQKQIVEWYPLLKEAIEEEQKNFLTKSKSKPDMNKYGPFLVLLMPQKLAVIVAHEAIMELLRRGPYGAALASLAIQIGDTVEAEVNVQRLLQERLEESRRLHSDFDELLDSADDETNNEALGGYETTVLSQEDDVHKTMSNWMYGASHLQQFIDEAHSLDPTKKTRMRIDYANRRAQRLLKDPHKWSKSEKLKLGVVLIEKLLESAVIRQNGEEVMAFSHEKNYLSGKKRVGRVYLNEQFYKMAVEDSCMSLTASTTRHKPMILPPRDWVAPDDGGYSWLKIGLMRTHSKLQEAALNQADLSNVFDALNVLGRVAWRINPFVLEAAQRCWRDNIPLGDIPSRSDLDVPLKPIRPERNTDHLDKESEAAKAANAEYRSYREALMRHYRIRQKNMDLISLRCSAILKLDQAEMFRYFDAIYFPYNLDFRGRAYPIPPHLSNVGSDLCRGLLRFAEAKPLGPRGLYWLKVHLANLAGNDKLTFDGRAEFTESNMDNVRAAVTDPFGENRWWMTLEDPFQGLATCEEIVNAIESGDPESYMCSLPVHMDGSCNGLQHYAALGRDKVGGKAVNLCATDAPQDVYSGVMHEVIRRVAEEAAIDLEYQDRDPNELSKGEKQALKNNRAAKLVNGLIDRGVVKRTVMTSVYGVTFIGARRQIQEKIEAKLTEAGYDIDEMENEIYSACGYLARLTMAVMGELFTGARQTMTWLATCARLIAQMDQPVAFVSPIGVPVIQPYRQCKPYTVVTLLQSVVLVDKSDDLPLHKQRQASAFPPNFVHSLDSSHMLLTALEMDRRGLTFSAVHDSFWTHACDVDEMNEALRDCFVELYEQPLLERLKASWELRYPITQFPDLPEKGSLDLEEVRSATYFFQ